MADSCRTGAATNVIFGLALGYKSVIIPIFAIAIAIYVSFALAVFYGIAVAALGMLSTIATGLAIDAYGPISDNAGGMAGMPHHVRERTDALDAAGNTTAAIGKVLANACYAHFLVICDCLCHSIIVNSCYVKQLVNVNVAVEFHLVFRLLYYVVHVCRDLLLGLQH